MSLRAGGTRHSHQHGVTFTRRCIDTICFSWWWAWHARNMQRTINKYIERNLCVKLDIYQEPLDQSNFAFATPKVCFKKKLRISHWNTTFHSCLSNLVILQKHFTNETFGKELTILRDIFYYSTMHLGECNSPKPRKIKFSPWPPLFWAGSHWKNMISMTAPKS